MSSNAPASDGKPRTRLAAAGAPGPTRSSRKDPRAGARTLLAEG